VPSEPHRPPPHLAGGLSSKPVSAADAGLRGEHVVRARAVKSGVPHPPATMSPSAAGVAVGALACLWPIVLRRLRKRPGDRPSSSRSKGVTRPDPHPSPLTNGTPVAGLRPWAPSNPISSYPRMLTRVTLYSTTKRTTPAKSTRRNRLTGHTRTFGSDSGSGGGNSASAASCAVRLQPTSR
jgi:hypothetical protein